MNSNELKKIADSMIDSVSRADWGKHLDSYNLKSGDMSEISDYLTAKSVLLAELSEYIDRRGGAGCGDDGHEKALEKAQKERKKIRKALGYSYP